MAKAAFTAFLSRRRSVNHISHRSSITFSLSPSTATFCKETRVTIVCQRRMAAPIPARSTASINLVERASPTRTKDRPLAMGCKLVRRERPQLNIRLLVQRPSLLARYLNPKSLPYSTSFPSSIHLWGTAVPNLSYHNLIVFENCIPLLLSCLDTSYLPPHLYRLFHSL